MSFLIDDADFNNETLTDTPFDNQITYFIIETALANNLTTLKRLLDAPKWYYVIDKDGYNLLQLMILRNNKEIFDYLLTLQGFPLEYRNKQDKTAFVLALTAFYDNNIDNAEVDEYFAIELLKKDVSIHPLALLQAAGRNFVQVVRMLLEKGVDPNVQGTYGSSALHEALHSFSVGFELEALLLSYGIDPLLEDNNGYTGFELTLPHPGKSELLEALCNHTIDEFSRLKVHLSVLLHLARLKSPFFHKVVDHVVEITIDQLAVLDYYMLFFIEEEYLKVFVEKCGFLAIYVVMSSNKIEKLIPFSISTETSIEELNTMIENTLNFEVVEFIHSLNSNTLFGALIYTKLKESTVINLICHLASYGMRLNELDLQMVYETYGYCTLFKMLLHMEFSTGIRNRDAFGISVIPIQKSLMPIFIYDIEMDLDRYLSDPVRYSVKHLEQLLYYFTHRKLKNFCYSIRDEKVAAKVGKSPDVPLLVQLARDASRKFLIDEFCIKNTRQFFTCVKNLPINNVYKKIITYETKLYR